MSSFSLAGYAKAEVATTNVAFTMGMADAVYIRVTITGGLTLTTPSGDVSFGLVPIGTTLRVSCTKATFAGGEVVALKAN